MKTISSQRAFFVTEKTMQKPLKLSIARGELFGYGFIRKIIGAVAFVKIW